MSAARRRLRSHLTKEGRRKIAYPHEQAAERTAARMRRELANSRIGSYRCKVCPFWHVGNTGRSSFRGGALSPAEVVRLMEIGERAYWCQVAETYGGLETRVATIVARGAKRRDGREALDSRRPSGLH